MENWVIRTLVLVALAGFAPDVQATPALWPINEKTSVGTWEAVDLAYGSVFRLEIKDGKATFAVANGPMQEEYLFKAEAVKWKKGNIVLLMKDEVAGVNLKVEGKGKASDSCGHLVLRLAVDRKDAVYWNSETYEFAKIGCGGDANGSLLEKFVEMEKRARDLIGGAPLRNQHPSPK